MNRKWLAVVGALAFVGCSQNESFVESPNSDSEDAVKSDDVQSALSTLPKAEVLSVSAAGVPSFIRGDLGKLDTAVGQLSATSPDFQASLAQIAPVFRLDSKNLQAISTESDALGSRHLRFAQVKNGLRVAGDNCNVRRPAFSSTSPATVSISPGVIGAQGSSKTLRSGTGKKLPYNASDKSPCSETIGPCTVTSFEPSTKVPSTCTSPTSSGTPFITCRRPNNCLPNDITCTTDLPSRISSSNCVAINATASG